MKKIKYIMLLMLLAITFAGCSEVNNWDVDSSTDRLFSSTHVSVVETNPTSVLISYHGIKDATKYVFEFSEGDSMLFNNIVRREEILADTLTPYSKSSNITQTEFQTLFQNLNGSTTYSVRVKGVDGNTKKESKFIGISFKTPNEQIFTDVVPGITGARIYWDSTKEADKIRLGAILKKEDEVSNDTVWMNDYDISSVSNGCLDVKDLNAGTSYIAQIYKGSALRGSYRFGTLGSANGEIIIVSPSDDISALLTSASQPVVTLAFTGGNEYNLGQLDIPENISSLYLSGSIVDGKKAHLLLKNVVFTAPMDRLSMQYVDVDNKLMSAFLIEVNSAAVSKNIDFTGCTIRNIQRSLFRGNNSDAMMEKLNINDCVINNVGSCGYGLINISKLGSLSAINITNSTITEIGDQLMDIRQVINQIKIDKVTIANYDLVLDKMFRIDKQPEEMNVTNCIFTGNNDGQKINSGYKDYSKWLDFSGCYLTKDLIQGDNKFINVRQLDISSDDLFVDPKSGDFHFKTGLNFLGDGKAGDPHWWTK